MERVQVAQPANRLTGWVDRTRQFLVGVREEMKKVTWPTREELVKATRMIVILSIVLGITIVILFVFLGSWNDFMWPLIILADQGLYTLPVALAAMSRQHVQDNELMMAGAVVTTLPVLILFLALQRFYLTGLLTGSVKG